MITIFDNPNFGTYLQALALGVVLKNMGASVEVIHYERPVWHVYSKFRKKTKFLETLRYLKSVLRGRNADIQRFRCRKFVGKRLSITKPYYSYDELVKNPPMADIYLTGSDQVWNVIHNHGVDKSFYLGFVPAGKPKYAYAASIGMDSIPNEFVEETKFLLSQYKAISVRENSNVDLLKQIGIESRQVLDPTLLLSADDWNSYACDFDDYEPYVLVYSVESKDRDREVGAIARKIADLKNFKVYEVSYGGPSKQIPFCDKHFFYSTPDLFLSLIRKASYIVGSSFHITAFAINFSKPFISVVPDRFSSRIDSLLSLTNLSNRKISDVKDLTDEIINDAVDFSSANKYLSDQKLVSFNFIKNILA